MVNEGHLIGIPGEHGKVVGGHEDGQVVGFPDFIQHIHKGVHSLHIHAGQGLVQNENVRDRLQGQGKQHPLQLTAGESAHPLVNQVLPVYPLQTGFYRLAHGFGQTQERGAAAHAAGEQIRHADGLAGIKAGALGHIADPGLFAPLTRLAESDDAGIVPLAQNGFQQGAFSGTVGADQSGKLPAVDVKLRVFQYFIISDFYGQFLHPQAAGLSAVPVVGKLFHPRASFTVSMLRYMASK